MTDAQKYRMRLVRAHMDYITAEINDVDKMIENMISSNTDFENAVQFLCTIPSVPFRVSNVIVQSLSSPKLALICLSSQVPNVYVAGLV